MNVLQLMKNLYHGCHFIGLILIIIATSFKNNEKCQNEISVSFAYGIALGIYLKAFLKTLTANNNDTSEEIHVDFDRRNTIASTTIGIYHTSRRKYELKYYIYI